MNKAVMRSLPPQICERIANGKQTMLVVKQQPKLKTPYKEYIYCTKKKYAWHCSTPIKGNPHGKVIGEYIVDKTISPIMAYCSNPNELTAGEIICGLKDKQIIEYLGNGKEGHGLHISDLVIYDTPKELGEFEKPCDYSYNCRYCNNATHFTNFLDLTTQSNGFIPCNRHLSHSPQSYVYVEEV